MSSLPLNNKENGGATISSPARLTANGANLKTRKLTNAKAELAVDSAPAAESADSSFVGFRTASRKAVPISAAALARAAALFADDTQATNNNKNNNNNNDNNNNNNNNNSSCLFQTASRKPVAVSAAARARAASLLDTPPPRTDGDQLPLFQTASKKRLSVSKSSLTKAKKLFDGVEREAQRALLKSSAQRSNLLVVKQPKSDAAARTSAVDEKNSSNSQSLVSTPTSPSFVTHTAADSAAFVTPKPTRTKRRNNNLTAPLSSKLKRPKSAAKVGLQRRGARSAPSFARTGSAKKRSRATTFGSSPYCAPRRVAPNRSAPLSMGLPGRKLSLQRAPGAVSSSTSLSSSSSSSSSCGVSASSSSAKRSVFDLAELKSLKRPSLREFESQLAHARFAIKSLSALSKAIGGDVVSLSFADAGAFVFGAGRLGVNAPVFVAPVACAQFRQRLLSAGADAKLLNDAWLAHHYRMIVWKLACVERAFPLVLARQHLTASAVESQLLYRFEIEVNRARRSVLHKLFEQDASCRAHMVLVLAQTLVVQPGESLVVLSDGWHCMRAKLDMSLSELLVRGRIAVGDKLRVHGAQISAGHAMSPYEEAAHYSKPSAPTLSLFYNSTRRAQWHAPLGAQPSAFFRVYVHSLRLHGGAAPMLQVCVLRIYPTRFYESASKDHSSRGTWLTEADENIEQRRFENERQKRYEKRYDAWLASGAANGDAQRNFEAFEASLANDPDWKQRDVRPRFRMLVAECGPDADHARRTKCIVSVWSKPALRQMLNEGHSYRMLGLSAGSRAVDGLVEMRMNRGAHIEPLPKGTPVDDVFCARACLPLAQTVSLTPGNWCDTVGVVASTDDSLGKLCAMVVGRNGGFAVLCLRHIHRRTHAQMERGDIVCVLDAKRSALRQSSVVRLPKLLVDVDAHLVVLDAASCARANAARSAKIPRSVRETCAALIDWLPSDACKRALQHGAQMARMSYEERNAEFRRSLSPESDAGAPTSNSGALASDSGCSQSCKSSTSSGSSSLSTRRHGRGAKQVAAFRAPSSANANVREAATTAQLTKQKQHRGAFALPVDDVQVALTRGAGGSHARTATVATRRPPKTATLLAEQRCSFHLCHDAFATSDENEHTNDIHLVLTFNDGQIEWPVLLRQDILRQALQRALAPSGATSPTLQIRIDTARRALRNAVQLDNAPRELNVGVTCVRQIRAAGLKHAPLLPDTANLVDRALELARRAFLVSIKTLREVTLKACNELDAVVLNLEQKLAECDNCLFCASLSTDRRVPLCEDEWQALIRAIVCVVATQKLRVSFDKETIMLLASGSETKVWPIAKIF